MTGSTTPVAGMTVELGMSRFPYFVQGRAIRITKATVVPLPDSPDDVVGIAPGRAGERSPRQSVESGVERQSGPARSLDDRDE